MLSDHELEAFREIERHLRWHSPGVTRLLDSIGSPPPRRRPARTKMLVVAAALVWLGLLGPRVLNEAEVTAQKSPPPPRISPPDANAVHGSGPIARPGAALTAPVALIDLLIGPSATATTADTVLV